MESFNPNSIEDLIRMDFFNYIDQSIANFAYVSATTPKSLSESLAAHINALPADNVGKFIHVCLLAATAPRCVVESHVEKPENAQILGFLREFYYFRDRLNFSNLNLIGHCIMAASGSSDFVTSVWDDGVVRAFRARAGGDSIWDADIEASRFSAEQKRIIQEKKNRISADDAKAHGMEMLRLLSDRHHSSEGSASGTNP